MAAAEYHAFPRISRDPAVHGGEPVVRGTRVPVRVIAIAWAAEPDMGAILSAYPRLTEADVREALAYYHAHRVELDERIQVQLAER